MQGRFRPVAQRIGALGCKLPHRGLPTLSANAEAKVVNEVDACQGAFVAIRGSMPWAIAGAGAAVVVIETIRQLGHFHENWMRYGLSKERLKREKYLLSARAGDYPSAENPDVLLAERIEDLISREVGLWITEERSPQGSTLRTPGSAPIAP